MLLFLSNSFLFIDYGSTFGNNQLEFGWCEVGDGLNLWLDYVAYGNKWMWFRFWEFLKCFFFPFFVVVMGFGFEVLWWWPPMKNQLLILSPWKSRRPPPPPPKKKKKKTTHTHMLPILPLTDINNSRTFNLITI